MTFVRQVPEMSQRSETRRKVVVVGMLDSVHVARWLSNIVTLDLEISLFPSSPHRRIHPMIVKLLSENREKVSLSRFWKRYSLVVWALDRFLRCGIRRSGLRRTVERLKPQLVHALESQSAGYLTAASLEARSPTMGLTLFGSDLYWFTRFPLHRAKIESLLQRADYLWCECSRDIKLAKSLGYRGEVFKTGPVAGGFSLGNVTENKPFLPASKRPYIAVKGYTNFVGRAEVALQALRRMRRELHQYEIVVYSATYRARLEAFVMRRFLDMRIRAIPKHLMSHEETLALLGQSGVFLGISDSDGLPSSTCEALAVGAFVIQSGTACCEEIISHKEDGYVLPSNSCESVVEALRFWQSNLELVDLASHRNRMRMSHFLDPARRRQELVSQYQSVLWSIV